LRHLEKELPLRPLRLTAVLLALSALVLPSTAAAQLSVGSSGLGDEYFPLAGNGGYDVDHYILRLQYAPATDVLQGHVTVRATATESLSRFNLDFRGFDIDALSVDDRAAAFVRDGQELIVTPQRPLVAGREFTVDVKYDGVPEIVVDPDESIEGWIPTDDGAFVVNEPQGSPGWYPANDNPRDKATFDFRVTVPRGNVALANGTLEGVRTVGDRATWRWRQDEPMAPYLATATNGQFETDFFELEDGLPVYIAVDRPERTGANFARIPQAIELFTETYGPYPFSAAGGIADNAGFVGYALETQTKANYANEPGASTVVHEVAHEWFGNAVTPVEWRDIWLNEGFARWSEWYFTERTGGATAAATFRTNYASRTDAYWTRPPADLGGPEFLFADPAYRRGAMTLQALRETIGEADFFALLRTWYAENRYGNVTTADFIETAERVSGEELSPFFQAWLFGTTRPPLPGP
jgi:aminopeptidase N